MLEIIFYFLFLSAIFGLVFAMVIKPKRPPDESSHVPPRATPEQPPAAPRRDDDDYGH